MPERQSLTEARMKALLPTKKARTIYDATVRELAARLRPAGGIRWYVIARCGRQRFVALGPWPRVTVIQARELAREALVKLARGADPVAEKRMAAAQARGGRVPFADALDRHLALLRERGRTGPHVNELERVVKAAIAAGMKDLAAPGIASKAAAFLDKLDVSDQTRHRYRVHLIAVGKTAVRWYPADVLPREPFLALSGEGAPMPAPPVFTPKECCALVSDEALAPERAADGGRLWAFLLYSGCRYKEAAFARWDRLNLDRSTFGIIPPNAAEHAAGERVKRGKSRTVALQPELVALLRKWHPGDDAGDGFVFDDLWRTQNYRFNVEAFRRQLVGCDIPLDGRRIHALRHAHACLAIAAGEDSLRLRLSMGHAGEEMAGHYASQAMRWRGLLAEWDGTFRLRDPDEVRRLTGSTVRPTQASA